MVAPMKTERWNWEAAQVCRLHFIDPFAALNEMCQEKWIQRHSSKERLRNRVSKFKKCFCVRVYQILKYPSGIQLDWIKEIAWCFKRIILFLSFYRLNFVPYFGLLFFNIQFWTQSSITVQICIFPVRIHSIIVLKHSTITPITHYFNTEHFKCHQLSSTSAG